MNRFVRVLMLTTFSFAYGAAFVACGGGDEDSAWTPTPPDVAGRYNVQILGAVGCDKDYSWVQDWAVGPLLIEGSSDSLTFDFYDDMSFPGQVDGSSKATFGGSASWADADLDVTWTGTFSHPEEQWVMEGEFSIVVDDDQFDTNNCTIDSWIEAYELVATN